MLDHIFLSVSDVERSISFYTSVLAPLGISTRLDYDGKDGPPGHPDLKGFGANGRIFFWLREGRADSHAAHVGFVANSQSEVDAAYAAAIAAGATDIMAHRVLDSPTTRATTQPMSWTRTAIASNSYIRVGSTKH